MKKNILFVCTGAIDRSPCAASLIEGSRFAGVGPLTENPVTDELVVWSDLIVCMEFEHKAALFEKFDKARVKDIVVLDVPNDYMRFDVELEEILKQKLITMELL